ncbi:unnamed protein product [Symbiodinium microadriaticum]|nr:unnamed protein product [Symbiodinium sp. KB8]CAE7895977.1 unnamed protein product [Symbiodinium microadriaticum]
MSPTHATCNSQDARASGLGSGAVPDVAEVNSAPVDIELIDDEVSIIKPLSVAAVPAPAASFTKPAVAAPKAKRKRQPAKPVMPVKRYNLRSTALKEEADVGDLSDNSLPDMLPLPSLPSLPPAVPPAVRPPMPKPTEIERSIPTPWTPEKEAPAASPLALWGLQRLLGPSAPPGEHTCAVCCALLRPMAATAKADLLRERLACDSCGRSGRGMPARDFLVCGDDLEEFLIWAKSDAKSGPHVRCCTYCVCRRCAQLPHSERRPRKRARHIWEERQ